MRDWRISLCLFAAVMALQSSPVMAGGFSLGVMSTPMSMHIRSPHIVPPLASFGHGATMPFPFSFGNSAVQADPSPAVNLTANSAAPEPPPPVVYNPPNVETAPTGTEVVRLMSTSPGSP
jgi:hypothetical protein